MAKLTKAQTKAHNEAVKILTKDKLSNDEIEFVYENWNEGAERSVSEIGAFFTPVDFACDFSLEVGSGKIIDLCAGIGVLSHFVSQRQFYSEVKAEITCVEQNYKFVEIGKKLLPHARWIHADVLDYRELLENELKGEKFDYAISNPPFGKIKRTGNAPRYSGGEFEFHVMDIAAELADYGAFIVPQQSANFSYSGKRFFENLKTGRGVDFGDQTGWNMTAGVGIDTSVHANDWKNTRIVCEVVNIDYQEDRAEKRRKLDNLQMRHCSITPIQKIPEQIALF